MSTFCNCQRCQRPIEVCEIMYSLTFSKDKVTGEYDVQPLHAESVAFWCEECGPVAVKELLNVHMNT